MGNLPLSMDGVTSSITSVAGGTPDTSAGDSNEGTFLVRGVVEVIDSLASEGHIVEFTVCTEWLFESPLPVAHQLQDVAARNIALVPR